MKKFFFLFFAILTSSVVNAQDDVTAGNDNVNDSDNQVNVPVVQRTVVQETVKFGYLSYNDVMRHTEEYAEMQQTIKSLRDAYEQELRRSEDTFSKQFAEYIDGQKSFPENILLKRQKELQQLMEEAVQFKIEAKQLLEAKEKEVTDRLRRKIDRAINQIGMERHYAFIINTDGDTYPFVNSGIGEDVTAAVMQKLSEMR